MFKSSAICLDAPAHLGTGTPGEALPIWDCHSRHRNREVGCLSLWTPDRPGHPCHTLKGNCWALLSHRVGPPSLGLLLGLHILTEAWPRSPDRATVPLPGHTWSLLPLLQTLTWVIPLSPSGMAIQLYPGIRLPPPATDAFRVLQPSLAHSSPSTGLDPFHGPLSGTCFPSVSSFCLHSVPRPALPTALASAVPSASPASSLLHPPCGLLVAPTCCLVHSPHSLGLRGQPRCCVPAADTQDLCAE